MSEANTIKSVSLVAGIAGTIIFCQAAVISFLVAILMGGWLALVPVAFGLYLLSSAITPAKLSLMHMNFVPVRVRMGIAEGFKNKSAPRSYVGRLGREHAQRLIKG